MAARLPRTEYTDEYMIEKLTSWTPYSQRWLSNLSHGQLRALFQKKQQEILYGITKDPANKPKPRNQQKQRESEQMTLGL